MRFERRLRVQTRMAGYLLAASLLLPGCASTAPMYSGADRLREVAGVIIVVDVTTEKRGIEIVADSGRRIAAPSLLGKGARGRYNFFGPRTSIPKSVHVTWRDGAAKKDSRENWVGGITLGDYIVPVASRIPNEVIAYLSSPKQSDVMGRELRIKIRLKDDGVLVAWDVEEGYKNQYGNFARYVMPGGDFIETRF
jgi:hypothetical protein